MAFSQIPGGWVSTTNAGDTLSGVKRVKMIVLTGTAACTVKVGGASGTIVAVKTPSATESKEVPFADGAYLTDLYWSSGSPGSCVVLGS